MKKFKTITMLALAASALAGTASAQTKIYITGATAFRSAAHQAIQDTLAGETVAAFVGTSASSSDAVLYTGGNIGGIPVTIKTSFAGSTGGIQVVAANSPTIPVKFLPDGVVGASQPDPRNSVIPAQFESAVADMTFSDCYQANSVFRGNFQTNNYSILTDKIVGVVSFRWVASDSFPTDNITPNQIQKLLSFGSQPLALFTGLNADQDKFVYVTGRNPDSGTRVIALSESGYGAFTTVVHNKPNTFSTAPVASKNGVCNSIIQYPIETINGVSTDFVGNSGESSGSSMRNFLTHAYVIPGETATYMVGAMSASDFNSISGDGAVPLKWNGVAFSEQAVQEGSYTFWSYQHLMYKPLAGVKSTFATNLETNIKNVTNVTPNVRLSTMQVERTGDGTIVSTLYF
jgi:hypothetical protein